VRGRNRLRSARQPSHVSKHGSTPDGQSRPLSLTAWISSLKSSKRPHRAGQFPTRRNFLQIFEKHGQELLGRRMAIS
jgi:hypothetical protein